MLVSDEQLIEPWQRLDAAMAAECACPGEKHVIPCPQRTALMRFATAMLDPVLLAGLLHDRRDTEARLHAATDALRAVEYIDNNGPLDQDVCPACWRTRGAGHASDCTTAAALRPAGEG